MTNNKEWLNSILDGREIHTLDGLVARLLVQDPETLANALEQYYDNPDNDTKCLDHILNELHESAGEY